MLGTRNVYAVSGFTGRAPRRKGLADATGSFAGNAPDGVQ